MKMKILAVTFVIALLLVVSGQGFAETISMNFVENASNQIPTGGEMIGPLGTDSANWNHNTVPTTGTWVNGTQTGLIDGSGTATGVSIAWASSNCWWQGDGTGDDEHKLSVGYLDDGDSGSGKGVTVTLTDIPYDEYRVYGLFSTDSADGMVNFDVNGAWALGGDASTTAAAYGTIEGNNSANSEYWTDVAQGTVQGNYWAIDTSGATLTITGELRNDTYRGCMTGVVIEQIPEPATMILLGLGGLCLRRRKR